MSEIDYNWIVELQRKLSFPRFTGTKGEEEARKIIREELKKAGYTPRLEDFEVHTYTIEQEKLEVLEPWEGEIPCRGVGFSGSTPPEGVEGELVYAETGDTILLPKEENRILLLSQRPRFEQYKKIMKCKPAGLIISESNIWRDLTSTDWLYEWKKYGTAPAVMVRFPDAYKLLSTNVKKVKLTLIQHEKLHTAYNIVVEKKGVEYPDEIIVVGGHYDSEYDLPGSIDNAGGTAFVIALAKAFSNIKTKRTIRFVLFAAEELGLRGSLAYVKTHKRELDKIKFMLNFDVHGGALGSNSVIVSGPPQVKPYLETIAKKKGINLSVSEDIMSSDSTSFTKEGIPAVSFYRNSGANAPMHTKEDSDTFIGPTAYKLLFPIALEFLELLANAEEFPFPRETPEQIKKKVKEYFEKRLGIEQKN